MQSSHILTNIRGQRISIVDISHELAVALDSSFAAAYIDNGTSYRFLGVKVRPFCLWHLLLLQTINSPFVMSGYATLFDLKTAIGACRLKYRESKIRRPWFPWKMPSKDLKQEVNRFVEYIGDYSSNIEYNIIPFDTGQGDKPPPRIVPPPGVVVTAFNAAQGARVSIEDAWNMPIGEANIAQAMHYQIQGSRVSFFDDDEREFQRQMKESLK